MLSKLNIKMSRNFERPTDSRQNWGEGIDVKKTPFLFLILAAACLILSLMRPYKRLKN